MYDAYCIEKAIENLCQHTDGKRGKFYDADVFRCGGTSDLQKFLEKLSQTIKDRVFPLLQTDDEKRWLDSAIGRISEAKSWIKNKEPNDYHWLVVAGLASVIAFLLQRQSESASNS